MKNSGSMSNPVTYFNVVNVITPNNLDKLYTYTNLKQLPLQAGNLVLVPFRNTITYAVVVEFLPELESVRPLKDIQEIIEGFSLSPSLVQFMVKVSAYTMSYLGAVFKMVIPSYKLLTQSLYCSFEYYSLNLLWKDLPKLSSARKSLVEFFIHNLNDRLRAEDRPGKIVLAPQFETNSSLHTSKPRKRATNKKNLIGYKLEHDLSCEELKKLGELVQFSQEELIQHNFSQGTINFLTKMGQLLKVTRQEHRQTSGNLQNITEANISLNKEQSQVAGELLDLLQAGAYKAALLYGITGSGKTEVYFDLIYKTLQEGGKAMVLVPEIALSAQWLERFKICFGVDCFVWHSGTSKKNKEEVFSAIVHNKVRVLVGTRSALFLPLQNVRLIVVDEEHVSSFKQDTNLIYNGRDLAVLRAKLENALVVLASATPSVESYYNTKVGKYKLLTLFRRYNQQAVPVVRQISYAPSSQLEEGEGAEEKYISPELLAKLKANLKQKGVSLVFLNRRGHSKVGYCNSCRSVLSCPVCSHEPNYMVGLTYHKLEGLFRCHRCGYQRPSEENNNCPTCQAEGSLSLWGCGVEKIAEELKACLPFANIVLASSDSMNTTNKVERLIEGVQNGKVDIIVATQILAKGYDFPQLNLVGIIDIGLDENVSEDLKSREKALQMLHQVTGRAGRGEKEGEVYLQVVDEGSTRLLNKSYTEFLEEELELRQTLNYPPYAKWAAVIVSSESEKKLQQCVNQLDLQRLRLPRDFAKFIKPPAKATYYKYNKKFRYRFLVSVPSGAEVGLHKVIKYWLATIKPLYNVTVKVDIDAVSFF